MRVHGGCPEPQAQAGHWRRSAPGSAAAQAAGGGLGVPPRAGRAPGATLATAGRETCESCGEADVQAGRRDSGR